MTTTKACDHCGSAFESKAHNARFCGAKCRKGFNNLRMTRGALLYDVVMKGRYDRSNWNLDHGKNWQNLTCDLARVWRGQDQDKQTWTDPDDWFDEMRCELTARRVA